MYFVKHLRRTSSELCDNLHLTPRRIGEQKRQPSRGLHSFIQYVECCNGVVKPW